MLSTNRSRQCGFLLFFSSEKQNPILKQPFHLDYVLNERKRLTDGTHWNFETSRNAVRGFSQDGCSEISDAIQPIRVLLATVPFSPALNSLLGSRQQEKCRIPLRFKHHGQRHRNTRGLIESATPREGGLLPLCRFIELGRIIAVCQ